MYERKLTSLLIIIKCCILSIYSVGCTDDGAGFSRIEQGLFLTAAHEWAYAVDNKEAALMLMSVEFIEDAFTKSAWNRDVGHPLIIKGSRDDPYYKEVYPERDNIAGAANVDLGNIVIFEESINRREHAENKYRFLRAIALHEIGHIMGLDHLEGGVMSEVLVDDQAACIDDRMLDLVCESNDCGKDAQASCDR